MLRWVLASVGVLGAGCAIDTLGKARVDGGSRGFDTRAPFDAGPCAFGCDDGVDCTADSCDGTRCQHVADDARCTAAAGGTCDGMRCNYPTCSPATCVSSGCETASCVGDSCVRESTCDGSEMCCAGSCVPLDCDDANGCTDDRCDPVDGCVHDPNLMVCDDGDPCTTDDICALGFCGGLPRDCDDGNECTIDFCDPTSGACATTNDDGRDCRDGRFCTIDEVCMGGSCGGGRIRSCGGPPCSCDEADDRCEHMDRPCS